MSPTNPEDARYTLTELADLAGVTPRTVRYYLAQGLLPTVGVAGPGAKYDDAHLARLRLIRRLQREHQPLAEIRQQLAALDDADVLQLAGEQQAAPPPDSALDYIRRVTNAQAPMLASAPPPLVRPLPKRVAEPSTVRAFRVPPIEPVAPTAPGAPVPDLASESMPMPRIERSQWERIALTPDVELHIRRPLPRSTAKRVDRLVEIAHDLLEEDLP